jgi:hypothetical protein
MQHEIEITVKGDRVMAPAKAAMPELRVGDKVHYFSSTKGRLTILFDNGTPFEKNQITNDDAPLEVIRAGTFRCGCRFKIDGKPEFGWGLGGSPESENGGEHVIRPT